MFNVLNTDVSTLETRKKTWKAKLELLEYNQSTNDPAVPRAAVRASDGVCLCVRR